MMYHNLLTTQRTLDIRTEEYHVQPAMVGVNKHVSEEATGFLCNENDFVILEVDGDSANWYSCWSYFDDIPPSERFPPLFLLPPFTTSRQPTLYIKIKDRQRQDRQPLQTRRVRVISGQDGIRPLVSAFGGLTIGFRGSTITLTFHGSWFSQPPSVQIL